VSDTDLAHLQIGSGALSLGLVVPVVYKAGISTTIVNRWRDDNTPSAARCAQLKSNRSYSVKCGDTEETIEGFNFKYFTDPLPESLLASPRLLITTAVTADGLKGITEYLASILQARFNKCDDNSITYIIACENMPNNSQNLKGKLRQHAMDKKLAKFNSALSMNCAFLNTVVDRICTLPEPHATIQTEVRTESKFQWFVDVSTITNREPWVQLLKEKFEPHWRILTNPQFSFFEKRKAWFVNGGHLALAAYASTFQDKHLYRALKNPKICRKLDLVFKAMSYALDYYRELYGIPENGEISLEGNIMFGQQVKERFEQSEDTVGRIHRSLMKAETATEILNKIFSKLSAKMPNLRLGKKDIISLIDALDINQYTERVLTRIIDGMEHLLEYNDLTNGELFKKEPYMAAEVISLGNQCMKVINSELARTTNSLRETIED